MTEPILPALKPIPIKDRLSVLFVEKGRLDVLDGAFVLVDQNGVRTHIPVGGVACLMLEPGARVSHAAAVLAARLGARGRTVSSIRPNSRLMIRHASRSSVKCMPCGLKTNLPPGAV